MVYSNILNNHMEKIIMANGHSMNLRLRLVHLMIYMWTEMKRKGHPITISASIGTPGVHSKTSKHYTCGAIDFNPDKGYSLEYVRALKTVYNNWVSEHVNDNVYAKIRILIEFHGDIGAKYKCTHVEFNDLKTGVFFLNYATNVSQPVGDDK